LIETLQEICHLITDGKHGDCQSKENSGYFFISCKDVKEGWIDYSKARQITEDDFIETHRRTQLEANDIVITNSGTIGRMALVQDIPETNCTTFQKSVAIIKPNKDKVLPRWLYYSLTSNREQLVAWAGGTAQKNLLLRDLRAFTLEVPPISTQRKIAAVLSAYDDLIENNTRRIQILEEMAQTIYREWFVNFRFPGHEGVRMVDSGTEMGEVPEGWEVVYFTDIIDVMSGGTPRTTNPDYWNGDIPWFTPKDISNNYYVLDTERKITKLGLNKCNSKLYPTDTVFITARGTVGKCVLASKPMAMSQTNYALVGNQKVSQYFVHQMTLSIVETFRKKATGAVFDTIIVDTFRQQRVINPSLEVVQKFNQTITPIYKLLYVLQCKNVQLQSARDLLLPKLISGEIDVGDMEVAGMEAVNEDDVEVRIPPCPPLQKGGERRLMTESDFPLI
jgi:type I restriction enzyme, S subunit